MNVKMVNSGRALLPAAPGKKYKVLIITDVFKLMAGSEKNITQLLTGINSDRFDLFAACFVSGPLACEMRERGYQIFDLLNGGLYTLRGLKNLSFLRKLIRSNGISLIVSYHEGSDFYGLTLSRICGIPIISNRRDMGFKTKKHHKIAYRLVGRLFNVAISVSERVKGEVVRQGWFHGEKVFTIYNGVDLSAYTRPGNRRVASLRDEIGIGPGPVVGLIANIRKIKGIEYFIIAASIVSRRHPGVEFLIAGKDLGEPGCSRATLESLARELGVSEKVHFLGMRSDVADLISLFDLGVVASLSEGFPNVVLEYMAASKPVVVTDAGGNGEAVVHGETGLLVPAGDAGALAEAIKLVLCDRAMALRFGLNGRRRAQELFSIGKMIENYEHIFERVLLSGQYAQ